MWIRKQFLAASVFLLPVSAWAAPVPSSEYVFVRDADKWVGVQRGERVLVGKLDAEGNFIKKGYEYPFGSGTSLMPPHKSHEYRFAPGTSLIPPHSIINLPVPEPRHVYEMRSFRLIRGVLIRGGTFVPDPGAPELSFEEYTRKYTPASLPIWNLPGYFKKVEKGKDAKDEKK